MGKGARAREKHKQEVISFRNQLTPANREILAKAMDAEIHRQVLEHDKEYWKNIDACVLWTLHTAFGFGKKRLRRFYKAVTLEHERLVKYYEMPDDNGWLCAEMLRRYGVDLDEWDKEVEAIVNGTDIEPGSSES